jgi:hypothetical protein
MHTTYHLNRHPPRRPAHCAQTLHPSRRLRPPISPLPRRRQGQRVYTCVAAAKDSRRRSQTAPRRRQSCDHVRRISVPRRVPRGALNGAGFLSLAIGEMSHLCAAALYAVLVGDTIVERAGLHNERAARSRSQRSRARLPRGTDAPASALLRRRATRLACQADSGPVRLGPEAGPGRACAGYSCAAVCRTYSAVRHDVGWVARWGARRVTGHRGSRRT